MTSTCNQYQKKHYTLLQLAYSTGECLQTCQNLNAKMPDETGGDMHIFVNHIELAQITCHGSWPLLTKSHTSQAFKMKDPNTQISWPTKHWGGS